MRHLLIAAIAVLLTSPTGRAAELSVVGSWVLNKDLTPMPDGPDRRPDDGRRGPRGGGRGGGRGGFGGGGFGGGSNNGPSDAEIHKMESVRDRLTEIPDRLTITKTESAVTIADSFGRTATLKTDGKKQPRVTGEGEFNSKTHFEGVKLIVEDDFNGPKITTTYEPILDRGEIRQLKVTLHVEGMGGRGGRMGGPPPGGGFGGRGGGFGGGRGGGFGGGRGGYGGGGRAPEERGDGQPRPGGGDVVRIYDAADQQ